MDLTLRQRLAPGDLDQPALVARDFGEDALKAALGASVEGVGGVTPRAPQRAARESNEDAGTPRIGGFALDAEEDFGDAHRSEEHTSELQSRLHLVCRLLLEKKKKN